MTRYGPKIQRCTLQQKTSKRSGLWWYEGSHAAIPGSGMTKKMTKRMPEHLNKSHQRRYADENPFPKDTNEETQWAKWRSKHNFKQQ